jgi:hypothetical protein
MGGAAGVAVAVAAVPVLVARAGVLIPRSHDVAVDGPVLLVSVAVAIGTGLIVGLLPSLRAGRGSTGTEAAGARGTGERGEARRLLDGLVFAEAGLAVVLLVGGGLLMRSFVELRSVDPGFDAELTRASTRRACSSQTWWFTATTKPTDTWISGIASSRRSRPFPGFSVPRR